MSLGTIFDLDGDNAFAELQHTSATSDKALLSKQLIHFSSGMLTLNIEASFTDEYGIGSYPIEIVVTDDNSVSLSTTYEVTVHVVETLEEEEASANLDDEEPFDESYDWNNFEEPTYNPDAPEPFIKSLDY